MLTKHLIRFLKYYYYNQSSWRKYSAEKPTPTWKGDQIFMHSTRNITVHWMVINDLHHYLHRLPWILNPPNPRGSTNTHPTPFVCTLQMFFPTQCKRMLSVPQIVTPKLRTWEPSNHKRCCICNSHGGQRLSTVEVCFLTPKTITKMWCARITRRNGLNQTMNLRFLRDSTIF